MPVRALAPGDPIDVSRAAIVIWIHPETKAGTLAPTLRALLAHTPVDAVLVVTEPTLNRQLVSDASQEVVHLPQGEVAAAGVANDVVLLDAGCLVTDGWLDRLRRAAYSDALVATACALPSAELGDIVAADGPPWSVVASRVDAAALRSRPRLEAPVPGCVYVRRAALELVGPLTPDFASRCTRVGLVHVLADDALVVGPGRAPGQTSHDEPLGRAVGVARRAARGLSLVVDARMGVQATGTLVHTAELIAALGRHHDGAVRVVTDRPGRETLSALDGVELIHESEAMEAPGDVVHRPLQVLTPWQLTTLGRMGARVIVSHHDLIAYRNPFYFESRDAWERFRAHTRVALASTDCVVFGSPHARQDALADDLVTGERAVIVPSGVDHGAPAEARVPDGAQGLDAKAEVILCLGADYRHKNRPFAMRVVQALQRSHDWSGRLLFAGPRARYGGSAAEEDELCREDSRLAEATLDLGRVSEAEKEWLIQRADLVAYPTLYEGFGLVPFEAARRGVPCLWAATTSLRDWLGEQAPIVMWDAEATSARALALVRDPGQRRDNVDSVNRVAEKLTWDAVAAQLLEIYRATCDGPPSQARAVLNAGPERVLSEDALRLLGPGGALPLDVERPLLALATHPRIARPVFRVMKVGYRLSYSWQRRHRDGDR